MFVFWTRAYFKKQFYEPKLYSSLGSEFQCKRPFWRVIVHNAFHVHNLFCVKDGSFMLNLYFEFEFIFSAYFGLALGFKIYLT